MFAAWRSLHERHGRKPAQAAEFEAFAANPAARCAGLSQSVRSGLWQPMPFRSITVPKAGGGERTLRVPVLDDRVVLAALGQWLAEAVEPCLHDASHAYRGGRGTATALRAVEAALQSGQLWALKADVRDFFDSVDPLGVIGQLKRWGVWAHRLAHVLRLALRAEVDGPDGRYCMCRGLAQGSPISPVLANVALDAFDRAVAGRGVAVVRYADDFLLLSDTRQGLVRALDAALKALGTLGLTLNEAKTAWLEPGAQFKFLGHDVKLEREFRCLQPARATSSSGALSVDSTASPDTPAGERAAHAASPLLRTVYLVTDGARLSRDGDALVVELPGQSARHLPAARVSQILAFGATSVASGAIALCLDYGIPVMLSTAHGRRFGLIDPLPEPDLTLLAAQLDASRDPALGQETARALLVAKLRNSLLMLRRWQRHRPLEATRAALERVADAVGRARRASDLPTLRGIEGSAAAAYFAAFGHWLPSHWQFTHRRRRPPPDPVNAMLSYGYTVLYYNTLTLLLARGLQSRIGLLHAPRAGHHALASDLMEPFRPIVVDATVMELVCRDCVKPEDFEPPASRDRPCLMRPAARNRLIHGLEERLNTRLQVRGVGLALDLRRLMDMQVLSLVDRLRGRTTAFEAYVAR